MEYQLLGMEAQAELIYRSILSESPAYPDALHLLGVIFYQKGDALAAVPYIERALQSNQSFEGFHNSLGLQFPLTLTLVWCLTVHFPLRSVLPNSRSYRRS